VLNDREYRIFEARRLADEFGVSASVCASRARWFPADSRGVKLRVVGFHAHTRSLNVLATSPWEFSGDRKSKPQYPPN
jgi:hypothetical protein